MRTSVTVDDLRETIARYLGVERTERSLQSFEASEGMRLAGTERASIELARFAEQLLASAVGSSSARLILSLLFQRGNGASPDALRLLDDASEALHHNRDLLQTALDQMEQGITVFDRDLRLICWNSQYFSLFELPDEMGRVGVSVADMLRHLVRRGDIQPGEDDLVMREIKPADLGIPDSAFASVEADTDGDATRAAPLSAASFEEEADLGNMVAFFAAQSTETTPEKGYEVTLEDGSTVKQNYGVFTHTIFSAMARNPAMTYRQLAQSVLASYAAGNMLKPTPLFEGSLDMPIFGNDEVADVAQWPTVVGGDKGLTISAGQLHGLAKGTRLLVLPSPAATNEEAIGVLEVASNDQLRSKLAPSSDDTHARIELADVPVGAYVRLVETAYPFELVVAKPDPATADAAQLAAVDDALASILGDAEKPLRIKVVEAGEPADVRLAVYTERQVFDMEVEADRAAGAITPVSASVDATSLDETTPLLWLLPTTGDISLKPQKRSAAMDLGATEAGDFTSNLSQNLVTIFRATSLSRLSQVSTFKPKDFTLTFGVQAAGGETIAALEPEQTPIVRPGDRLYVDMTNKSGKAVDLNVLYVDHDYGITLLCTAHLANNDKLFQPIADLNETDRAAERIVAVVNESGKDLTDLSFLEQRGIVVRTRGAEDTSLIGMLADLGAGQPTRGPAAVSTRDTKQPRGAVVMVPVEVLEPSGETPAAEIAPVDERASVGSCG